MAQTCNCADCIRAIGVDCQKNAFEASTENHCFLVINDIEVFNCFKDFQATLYLSKIISCDDE